MKRVRLAWRVGRRRQPGARHGSAGDDDIEMVPGAGHRDIQEASFLVDLLGAAGGEVGRNAAVDRIQQSLPRPIPRPLAEWIVERMR